MAHRTALTLVLLSLLCGPADARSEGVHQVIVKFRSDGPSALTECAEALSNQRRSFAAATSDASDSLDRLHQELGVLRVRALYRRPDGSTLDRQRRKLNDRLQRVREHRRSRRPKRGGAAAGGKERPLPDLSHIYVVDLPRGIDAEAAAERYRNDPHVLYAQSNFRAVVQSDPNDPYFSSSGSWGQPYADLWGLFQIHAPEVWPTTQGEGIVVAVIDTGLDYDHPDIAANVWVNLGEDLNGNGRADVSDMNGIDDDGNGYVDDIHGFDFSHSIDNDENGDFGDEGDISDPDPFDDYGHGTHVAGTIAAVGNNGIGVVGVAPRARIMAIKGLDETGGGEFANLALAFLYAIENHADIINASWSCSGRCPENPVIEEAVALAHDMGLVLVFSAGNRADDVVYNSPEKLRETIVVGALNPDETRSAISNLGFLLDVMAPGRDPGHLPIVSSTRNILSLLASAAAAVFDPLIVGDHYMRLSGTSMSAPHVAGIAALLLSADPNLTNEDVRTAIRLGAVDLGPPGHDRETGAGRADALASLALGRPPQVFGAIRDPAPGAVANSLPEFLDISGSAMGSDLATFAMFYGRGLSPDEWLPLGPSRSDPVVDGLLAQWPVGDLENGSYVLRLELVALDGSVMEEFTPLSLERTAPHRISSPGPDAGEPAVSGDLVVWSSVRETTLAPDDPGDEIEAHLFISDLKRGSETPLGFAPGAQFAPAISGSHVAWLGRPPDDSPALFHCHYEHGSKNCDANEVARGSGLSEPSVSGERIAWSANGDQGFDVFSCSADISSGMCEPRIVVSGPSSQTNPVLDGVRLGWQDHSGNFSQIYTCIVDDATDTCPATRVRRSSRAQIRPAVSGDVFAWEDLVFPEDRVRVCRLDVDTGKCRGPIVDRQGASPAPAVSGDWAVWTSKRLDEDTAIFFCEHDRVLADCPVQRLTGAAAGQRGAAIDGNRVVWEDRRSGAWEIWGIELPEMTPMPDETVSEGVQLRLRVRARDSAHGPLSLVAKTRDADSIEALGASFWDRGHGRGEFRWTPGFEQAGRYVVTFIATNERGIQVAESLRIDVEDVNRPPVAVVDRHVQTYIGNSVLLDGCASFDPDGDPLTHAWFDDSGELLQTSCAFELAEPERPGARRFVLSVSDGEHTDTVHLSVIWRGAVRGGH